MSILKQIGMQSNPSYSHMYCASESASNLCLLFAKLYCVNIFPFGLQIVHSTFTAATGQFIV